MDSDAVVNIGLAIISLITRGTGASVAVDAIHACATIQTWIRNAVVNVCLAIGSLKSS